MIYFIAPKVFGPSSNLQAIHCRNKLLSPTNYDHCNSDQLSSTHTRTEHLPLIVYQDYSFPYRLLGLLINQSTAESHLSFTSPEPIKGKALIIKEATKLFRAKGYSDTTIRDIANACQLKSASLFHHFKNKEDILVEVMLKTIEKTTEQIKYVSLGVNSPQEKLKALIHYELELIHSEDSAMYVVHMEWRYLKNDACRDYLLQLRKQYERHWYEAIQDCCESNGIKAHPKLLRQMLEGAMSKSLHWYSPDYECDDEFGAVKITNIAQLAQVYFEHFFEK